MEVCDSIELCIVELTRVDCTSNCPSLILWVCHFPIGILGQVWYLIVSIPDLRTLTYFDLFVLILKSQTNNFSVKSEQFSVSLGWTSTKQRIKCLAQGHNTVTPEGVSLELATLLQSNTLPTEPLHSANVRVLIIRFLLYFIMTRDFLHLSSE